MKSNQIKIPPNNKNVNSDNSYLKFFLPDIIFCNFFLSNSIVSRYNLSMKNKAFPNVLKTYLESETVVNIMHSCRHGDLTPFTSKKKHLKNINENNYLLS